MTSRPSLGILSRVPRGSCRRAGQRDVIGRRVDGGAVPGGVQERKKRKNERTNERVMPVQEGGRKDPNERER